METVVARLMARPTLIALGLAMALALVVAALALAMGAPAGDWIRITLTDTTPFRWA